MKWLEFTDLHLNHRDPNGYEENGINFRFSDKIDILKYIVKTAIENEVSAVVNLGDTWETSRVPSRYRAMYFDTLKPLFDKQISVFTMIGNHDVNALEHVFQSEQEALHGFQSNIIVSKVKEIIFPGDNMRWVFVPYMNDQNQFPELVKKLKQETVRENMKIVVFCHEELQGMTLDNGIPVAARSDVSLKNLPKGNIYWRFGHYHAPKELPNITFIGNSSRLNFSEEGIDFNCRVCSYDGKDHILEKVHSYKDRPFVTKRIDFDSMFMGEVPEANWNKHSVVRLIISGPREKLFGFTPENLPPAKHLHINFEYTDSGIDDEDLAKSDGSIEELISNLCETEEQEVYCKSILKGIEECQE